MRVCEAFFKVVDLAILLGVKDINKLPGCWEHSIDEHWAVAINAHSDEAKTSKGVSVKPFVMYIEFNGWPAGMVSPQGGAIAAGSLANENTFVAAIDEAIKKLKVAL